MMLIDRNKQHGFSLLEAIVALVLISTSGMALFSWINNTLVGLNHALVSNQRKQYRQNALALMQQINPLEQKTGEIKTPEFVLSWQSTALTPIKQEIDSFGIPGSFAMSLYESKVQILQGDGQVDEFTVRQIGFQRTQ